jgi:non-ribosomal peptide synthetase-like protein
VALAAALFVALTAIPIGAKWLLIGKWKPESFPIWSLRYFRFWMVDTLVRAAPLAAYRGSPLYNIYLRLLGAKIGRNSVISSRVVPVATDLFCVGDNTILRKDSVLPGYRAQSNFIHIGSVRIGSNAFVGEASVLDIDTEMDDGTQLGHASSLQSGQRVPAGSRYHGSPAIETTADYCPIEGRDCSSLRRGLYAALELATLLAIVVPIPILVVDYWYFHFAPFGGSPSAGFDAPTPAFDTLMLLLSAGLFFGLLAAGLLGLYLVPRMCQLMLDAERTYVLYGFHYWLQRVVATTSNSRFYNLLFGDSSLIVRYIQFVGWNLNTVEQTGSNFGTNQKQDNPFLCDVGSGTVVSDGLSMINMHMSSSSFRLGKARIGARNYLGNDVRYPPDGRTAANCLLATKVMVPVDGPVRENVGLLGSPCFEIPRMVERDRNVSAAFRGEARRQRLRRKNLHNAVTAAAFLLTRWMFVCIMLFVLHLAVLNYRHYGIASLFIAIALLVVAAVLFFAFIERASLGFGRLEPKLVSIYERYYWSHERHWKLSDTPIVNLFRGTPFKNLVSRLLGVKIGRKVYDGGCSMTERTLTEIGDYANLNEGSNLQCHSLEEGVFKSDYVRIGKGCSLGPGAFVHYGVTMGEHVVLDADSFLMKGEAPDPHSGWRGNPARKVRGSVTPEPVATRVAAAS